MKSIVLFCFFILLSSQFCQSLIQELDIRTDPRSKFFVQNFGFEAGGSISLSVSNVSLDPPPPTGAETSLGFIIERSQTDATRFLDESSELPCQLDQDRELKITSFESQDFSYVVKEGMEGFYNIYFVSCVEAKITFTLMIDLHNTGPYGPIYLSAGEAPLTTVFSFLVLVYLFLIIFWIFGAMRGSDKKVFLVHHLMTVLVILKFLSVLFKAIELHYLKIFGFAGKWASIYYAFSFLKGIMLFVVIAMVGTGWSFIKPFLADNDKKIFLFVIPLQILDNVALIIIEETAPGASGWFTWKDIFRLVDIICCGAILVPIIWSIRHLKEASQIDGKAARNMEKLKLFRQFYLIVVSYIYFTRIIVYLLDATLPFRWVWLGDLFTECATLTFFSVVGYKFRPLSNNPFLHVDEDDVEAPEK